MKISIATSILILLIAALIGVPTHQQIVALRETRGKLATIAAQLGITINSNIPDEAVRVTRRMRENNEVDMKAFSAVVIDYAREVEAMNDSGDPENEAQQKRSAEVWDRLVTLDAAQLKLMIAEIRAANYLGNLTCQSLIGFSIATLADDQPQTALALLTESSDVFKAVCMGSFVVSASLGMWAEDDPLAAVNWTKKQITEFPDLITDYDRQRVISGMAMQDPKLAFKLIGELGIEQVSPAISGIVTAAKTPEQRTAVLNLLREHLATLPDDTTRTEISEYAIERFAYDIVQGRFEASAPWLAEANFTSSELDSFASGLQRSIKGSETGKWIEWIGKKFPPDKANENIERLIRNWTSNDYQAAGEWLVSAPVGPLKDTAIQSYAATISEYEPATAVQWATTLPPGENRNQALGAIYSNWPSEDPAGLEAFKHEHGIE